MKTIELKQSVPIFRTNSEEAFIKGIYNFKYKKWTDFQIKEKRKPKSLNIAVRMANRDLNQIPDNKSANIDSQQQAMINTWKFMNGISFKSKRKLVDENFIKKCESRASIYKEELSNVQ